MHNHPSRSMKTSTLIRRFLPYFKKYRGMLFLDLVCAAVILVTTVYSGAEYFLKNRDVVEWSNL